MQRHLRRIAVAAIVAGCGTIDHLGQAERWLRLGRVVDARNIYVERLRSGDPKEKVLAHVGAARASIRLRDRPAARRYLEKAVALPEVPGASEEAYFEYAQLLRDDGDRPKALNFYYRAAAGAEKHRNKGFPYQQAVDAVAVLLMKP